ncbi:MAG: 1-deoxy-D-xylulose-5-phosphate synthase [Bacteroidetes bacterium]|nr:1-deoxy-D-xylulose-5-phosphate synthase [Bacteroidota bacterium]
MNLENLTPQEVKQLSFTELRTLAENIRDFLIDSCSKTGGHIGANLGVIELTIALHYVFDSPKDQIIWDTSHQVYTHKIITGRAKMFPTLNTFGGMARFVRRQESEHDIMDASHGGTSIATAIGLSKAKEMKGTDGTVIAVIGDGSLVEGLAWEALNHAAVLKSNMIIVVNDNGMAIAENVGGIAKMFSERDWQEKSKAFYQSLGFNYLSEADGHDVGKLIHVFQQARTTPRPTVVHIKTVKGHGLKGAENHPYKMHFSFPFDPWTLKVGAVSPQTYGWVAGDELHNLMAKDPSIIAVYPATPYASYLEQCIKDFPDRTIDVGMAEQHAMCFGTGLALNGVKPVVCYQSTFMQRAMDQIVHDACAMDLPVTIMVVRSGFSGYDGPTHHGIFDLSYLRAFPNLKLVYPKDQFELRRFIRERLQGKAEHPMAILYPYEAIIEGETEDVENQEDFLKAQVIGPSAVDGLILSVGNRIETAREIQARLSEIGRKFAIVNVRWLKPLPEKQLVNLLSKAPICVTLEENVLNGGFGSSIAELVCDNELNTKLLRVGLSVAFPEAGSKEELSEIYHIDTNSVLDKMRERWPFLFAPMEKP